MKLTLRKILIPLLFIGAIIITALTIGYVQSVREAKAATGGQFNIEWDYKRSGFENATSTAIATTSPNTISAGASTTVTVITNGVSDIRLNLTASTSVKTPNITIAKRTIGQNGVEYFDDSALSTSGNVTTVAGKNLISWAQATTSKAHLVESGVPKTSILISNINAHQVQFEFGSNVYTDLSIEIEKIYPNR